MSTSPKIEPSIDNVSLAEVHRSVGVPKGITSWKRLIAFLGPAYLVSVGYMDPGNWATDIEGGARFGYTFVWVLVLSNAMAILLQILSARLGIVSGHDLAQACREHYPKPVSIALWILCEIAIAACDLAEIIGTAVGLQLLFHIPLLWGVLITAADTFLLLAIQHFGMRTFEAFILSLVATIGGCFMVELFLAKPDITLIAGGLIPSIPNGGLYVVIGIIGATVMPHNLYLHSALVQTRAFEQNEEGKRSAIKYNVIDSVIALNGALFVNAAILILAASVFYKNGIAVRELQDAHQLLSPLLGTSLAGIAFAVALIAAGQSSTITGTLAGQIVMEGFLNFRMRPYLRRIITRFVALVPAVVVLTLHGEQGVYALLIFSQVVLSLQLPFAIVPLIHFTSSTDTMGTFANSRKVTVLAWLSAILIIALNGKLIFDTLAEFLAGNTMIFLKITAVICFLAVLALLVYVIVKPMLHAPVRRKLHAWAMLSEEFIANDGTVQLENIDFNRIGVTLAFAQEDKRTLSHACMLAQQYGATIVLIHVVESAVGRVFGAQSYDAEARADEEYLVQLQRSLIDKGVATEHQLGFGDVSNEIIRIAREERIEMLVMGGHGHRGIKDFIFGSTITGVRHELDIPIVVVR
jgi:manganese transport protein